nr:MAG: hypothetical protein [Bacteriophage sp.]
MLRGEITSGLPLLAPALSPTTASVGALTIPPFANFRAGDSVGSSNLGMRGGFSGIEKLQSCPKAAPIIPAIPPIELTTPETKL